MGSGRSESHAGGDSGAMISNHYSRSVPGKDSMTVNQSTAGPHGIQNRGHVVSAQLAPPILSYLVSLSYIWRLKVNQTHKAVP